MPDCFNLIQKAAIKLAAFFILCFVISQVTPQFAEAKLNNEAFDNIKKAASEKLSLKQKKEAMLIVSEYIKIETNKNLIANASEFLTKISISFISKEAQDFYESSINYTLENTKESKKQIEGCLQLDPQNADCLFQKARIFYREKNKNEVEKIFSLIKEILPKSKFDFWLETIVQKTDGDSSFKNKIFLKKFNEGLGEDCFIIAIFEIERAILVRNYSRAKEGVEYIEKHFSEWPDLNFFKNKINTDSSEEKNIKTEIDFLAQYASKCKNITKSIARKFRYDFELCLRGLF